MAKKSFFAIVDIEVPGGKIADCDYSDTWEESDITDKNIAMAVAKQARCSWYDVDVKRVRVF